MTRYREKFVVMGGTLIASIVGLSNRSTMDLDTTLRNLPLTPETIESAVAEICAVNAGDGISFQFKYMEPIRDDDMYGGYRVMIQADYGKIAAPMSMDISTGDIMTPDAIRREFSSMFDDEKFGLWSYNVETILAEKVETILRRNVFPLVPVITTICMFYIKRSHLIEMYFAKRSLRLHVTGTAWNTSVITRRRYSV